MRIAINCRSFLNKNFTGIGRYASELLRSLGEIDQENQYLLYAPKRFFSPNKKLPQIPARNFSLKIDRFSRGVEKTVGKMDLYHSPSPEVLPEMNGTKIVVTVHDLIFKAYPQGHTASTIALAENQFRDIVKKAAKIICCSQSTLNDLHQYFKVDPQKTILIYQGVNQKEFYPIDQQEEKIAQQTILSEEVEGPFILFVGTLEPRKNLNNLLAAFSLLKKKNIFPGKLVVIGMKGWLSGDLAARVEKLGIKEEVVFTGFLSNQALRYFYNKAEVFVFPSFYEGFGFPIVEAFSCGVPVVTSNVSSCGEIASDAALQVNPSSPEEIAQAISRVLEEASLRKELKEKGLKRAQEFTFLNTARQTLKVYKEVYSGNRS